MKDTEDSLRDRDRANEVIPDGAQVAQGVDDVVGRKRRSGTQVERLRGDPECENVP